MNYRSAIIALALFLGPNVSYAGQSALTFAKQIGSGGTAGWMSFVAFSPDGTVIASDAPATPDDGSGNLTLWSFPSGRLLKQIPARPQTISPNWKYYASANGVGDMKSGKPLISLGDSAYALHAFSPDSRYVAETVASSEGSGDRIRIVELSSAKQINTFSRLAPASIAINPDGVMLASGHWLTIKFWNVRTGKRIAVLHGFRHYVGGISFSKTGRLLAASDGSEVQIWDVRRRKLIRSVDVASYGSVPAFSPDGRLVAVGGYGAGTVSLIDVRQGKIIDHYKVSDLGCGSVAFSPDGHYLVTPSTGGLITWPYDKGGTIRVFRVRAPARQ